LGYLNYCRAAVASELGKARRWVHDTGCADDDEQVAGLCVADRFAEFFVWHWFLEQDHAGPDRASTFAPRWLHTKSDGLLSCDVVVGFAALGTVDKSGTVILI
jgi:hypothetical protein